jgi:hypothetical protein
MAMSVYPHVGHQVFSLSIVDLPNALLLKNLSLC